MEELLLKESINHLLQMLIVQLLKIMVHQYLSQKNIKLSIKTSIIQDRVHIKDNSHLNLCKILADQSLENKEDFNNKNNINLFLVQALILLNLKDHQVQKFHSLKKFVNVENN
jgi:hypothetical protein